VTDDRTAAPGAPQPASAHTSSASFSPTTVDQVTDALARESYIADRGLATAIFLALKRHKPLLLEGEPGVGKTEVARVLAALLGTRLIRLQCYEGIDQSTAVYEWNYARQLLYIRLLDTSEGGAAGANGHASVDANARLKDVFGPEFLIQRPLLEALEAVDGLPPVLLIDELDRSDAEFEAYLLELLSDYQITIPEIGPVRAKQPPMIVITSNRTRDIHDALRRRCLYYWIEYPTLEKEYEIVKARAPEAPDALARQVVIFVQLLRQEDLFKSPGVAETLDWIGALVALGENELTESAARDSLGALLKYQDDTQKVATGGLLARLVEKARTTILKN
jgi:MoxR-like ATPase